jgi:EAL domain-containing protein (putative c-di-GMP-specific phosphodiesterase class I)/ActR/RegA family two-component response regulator
LTLRIHPLRKKRFYLDGLPGQAWSSPAMTAMEKDRLNVTGATIDPSSVGAPPKARLLVIDDDPVQQLVIAGVAREADYTATIASSFEEAQHLLHRSRFDCVTLDLSLGKHDGVEVLRLLADLNHDTSVIVITGCEERIRNATVRLGTALGLSVSEPISKPLDPNELRRWLTRQKVATPVQLARPPALDIGREEMLAAIDHKEFFPEFQPKIELATGRIVGCEALMRWNSGRHGSISPDIFIPLAETWQLMPRLTANLLKSALSACRGIGKHHPEFSVAVNVSTSLLTNLALPNEVDEALAVAELPARALTLEVTESVAMADVDRATDILVRLRISGVGVSIDDFGTGYSSMSALARMPFSELKIDQTFVRQGDHDPDMWKIVAASIALARAFNMKAVAEGIENVRMWKRLKDAGCDIGQGFVFSPALSAEDLDNWVASWRPPLAASAG